MNAKCCVQGSYYCWSELFATILIITASPIVSICNVTTILAWSSEEVEDAQREQAVFRSRPKIKIEPSGILAFKIESKSVVGEDGLVKTAKSMGIRPCV